MKKIISILSVCALLICCFASCQTDSRGKVATLINGYTPDLTDTRQQDSDFGFVQVVSEAVSAVPKGHAVQYTLEFLAKQELPVVIEFKVSTETSQWPAWVEFDSATDTIYVKTNADLFETNVNCDYMFCGDNEFFELRSEKARQVFVSCMTAVEAIKFNGLLDTSNAKSMAHMFDGCKSLESITGLTFDTSNVSDMTSMFADCKSVVSLNLSSFDTSFVKSMKGMLQGCEEAESIILSDNFKGSSIVGDGIEAMFDHCEKLQTLDLSAFDVKGIVSLNQWFNCCYKLKNIKFSNKLDVLAAKNKSSEIFAEDFNVSLLQDGDVVIEGLSSEMTEYFYHFAISSSNLNLEKNITTGKIYYTYDN